MRPTLRRADRPEDLPDDRDAPIYCVTIDLDWASDPCIEALVGDLGALDMPLSVFATHRSPAVDRLLADPSIAVGIHPNFQRGSTHGETVDAVIEHMCALFPDARMTRSHCFHDSSPVSGALYRAGLRYDANIHYYLEPDLRPHRHSSGLVRFPTFWGDSQAMQGVTGEPWDDALARARFGTAGLKILNIHPFLYAMNIEDPADYRAVRHLTRTADADTLRRRASAAGGRSRVRALLDGIREAGGCFTDLPTLYAAWQAGRWSGGRSGGRSGDSATA